MIKNKRNIKTKPEFTNYISIDFCYPLWMSNKLRPS
jgi:hypothetical protein